MISNRVAKMGTFLGVLVMVVVVGCGDDTSNSPGVKPPASTQTMKVVQTLTGPFRFSPKDLGINQGDTVLFFNPSSAVHTTTNGANCQPGGLWDSGSLTQNQSFMVIFDSTHVDTSGVIPYYCIPHCSCCAMTGSITVNP